MALRQLLLSRGLHTCKALRATLTADASHSGKEHSSYEKWRSIFFYVCCPCILIGYVNIALEEHPERPEYVEYPYLRIRNRKFPWRDGVETLFHNPYYNAVPGGYEEGGSPPEPSWLYKLVKGGHH